MVQATDQGGQTGSLAAGESATVGVNVNPEFLPPQCGSVCTSFEGDTLVVTVLTPDATNDISTPIASSTFAHAARGSQLNSRISAGCCTG